MVMSDTKLPEMRNFTHIDPKLPMKCKLGVLTSKIRRYNRRCSKAKDFIAAAVRFTKKIICEVYARKGAMKYIQNRQQLAKSKRR